MKKYTVFSLYIALFLSFCSCENLLDEEPPFADAEQIHMGESGKKALLDGVYEVLIDWGGYRQAIHNIKQAGSGLFGSPAPSLRSTTIPFNIPSNSNELETHWANRYTGINYANDIIHNSVLSTQTVDTLKVLIETSQGSQEGVMGARLRDIIGNAYFLRSFLYFDLVRSWGEVPLRLEPTTAETIDKGQDTKTAIFDAIINDAKMATLNMSADGLEYGYPSKYAAHMLLAKVYMHLASVKDANDPYWAVPGYTDNSNVNYWDLAYVHADSVYQAAEMEGRFGLVSNYNDLFNVESSNHTKESIFEVNFNQEVASTSYINQYTPGSYAVAAFYGRLGVNPEVYDKHVTAMPEDPRISATYLSQHVNQYWTQGRVLYYPIQSPRKVAGAYPLLYKFCPKDVNVTVISSDRNYIVYRYADLLLMMAEIENERTGGTVAKALEYVEPVLERARNSKEGEASLQPASYPAEISKEDLREQLYYERQFELLGEGEDWFEVRRRGYQHFYDHVIKPHNDLADMFNEPNIDVRLPDNVPESAMLLPIPQQELDNNRDWNN